MKRIQPDKFRKIHTKRTKQDKSANLQLIKPKSGQDPASVLMLKNQKHNLTGDLKRNNLELPNKQIKFNNKIRVLPNAIGTTSYPTIVKLQQDTIPKRKDGIKPKHKDPRKLSPWALTGFISSIIGIVFWPLSICAIVFSAIALRKIRKNPEFKGRDLAKAGLIIGITVAAILTIIGLYVLLILSLFNS